MGPRNSSTIAGKLISTLVVTDKYAPHSGGTAVLWSEWCRRWPAESVRVVTRQFAGWEQTDSAAKYKISRVPYIDIPKVRMPLTWLQLFLQTARECRAKPDVLHCGQILETGIYAPWLKRKYGVKYAIHTYGEELNAYSRRPRLCSHMKRVLADSAGVTAVSKNTAGLLRSLLGYTGKIDVVYPGVDTDRFVPGDGGDIRTRLRLGDGPILLTTSRLMKRKGHDRVLEALPSVLPRFPGSKYVIGGSGPDEARLKQLVLDRGLAERVIFLGHVAENDLVPLLQTADVFVHPNRELENGDVEGFGIVFLEAGACGVPVIGGNSGGTPEAVADGHTGFLVNPDSIDEIADRINTLLGDASLRKEQGLAGRDWARKFSWDTAADKAWRLTEQVADCQS